MTIGVWGDSIAYGACDEEGLGWVGRLRKAFYSPEEHDEVYNRGVSGDTTEDLIKRFATELESIRPDRIVIAIGTNDSRYKTGKNEPEVPPERFAANLEIILDQAKTVSSEVVLIGPTRVNEDLPRGSGTCFVNEHTQKYGEILSELAKKHSRLYVSLFNALDAKTDLADGLHPNARGYEKMCEVIKSSLA